MLQNRDLLLNSKNLLAFSAGGDSTALLFLLLDDRISFDIAIVDYGLRRESKEEVAYAQELAKKYSFTCHLLSAEKIEHNFEANARAIRYDFFEKLIKQEKYTNLLTAHHLGDRFEWMLMQFCKGAGSVELSGMQSLEKRSSYMLHRPLLHLAKEELLSYLHSNSIQYFEDESNNDEKYKRNEFRHKYAKPLMAKYRSGIQKSFEYLEEDAQSLVKDISIESINQLFYFISAKSKRSDIFAIDRVLKSLGHMMRAEEKALLKSQDTLVIGREFLVCKTKQYYFIAPYISNIQMSKKFKEKMRLLKVEPKMRAYLFEDSEAEALVSLLLQ